MSDREVEFKRRIPDRAGFERLYALAGGRAEPVVEQWNHFFDGAQNELEAARVALRLRREGANFVITVKGPTDARAEGAPSTRSEFEWSIEPEVARRVIEAEDLAIEALVADHFAGVPIPSVVRVVLDAARSGRLRRIGGFRNLRTSIRTELAGDLPAVLELDCTHFPGGRVDYEVELEISEDAPVERYRAALDALLTRAAIPLEDQTSKLGRFRAIVAGHPAGEPN